MTILTVHNDAVPLYADSDGTVRVTGSRVLLDIVIDAYHRGDSPEEIAAAYDTLVLARVYAVIAYYLRHRAECDRYLKAREAAADYLAREIEESQRKP